MVTITLDFFKDRDAIDYPWEQPNTPWMIVPAKDNSCTEAYDGKLMIDHPSKQVWIKNFDGESWTYTPLGKFFAWEFNMLNQQDSLIRNNEFFYDIIEDLKRNLHNKQHQKIEFSFEEGHLSAHKLGKEEL